jgi:hypothetical protein
MYGQHDCATHSKGDAVKYLCALILAGLLLAGPALANSSRASDASVRQLLELTGAHKLIDAAKVQVNAMVTAAMQDAVQGRTLTPERQAIVERVRPRWCFTLPAIGFRMLATSGIRIARVKYAGHFKLRLR